MTPLEYVFQPITRGCWRVKQKMTRRHNHAMKNLINSVVIVSEIGNGSDCDKYYTMTSVIVAQYNTQNNSNMQGHA